MSKIGDVGISSLYLAQLVNAALRYRSTTILKLFAKKKIKKKD